jgi:hypothetical protein
MNALDELLIGNIRQQIKDILKLINYSMVNGKFSLNHLLKTDKMIKFIVQRQIENCSFIPDPSIRVCVGLVSGVLSGPIAEL